MPDLQSELNKILTQQQFDDEADAPAAKTKPASARERAWHFIKANPGCGVAQIAEAVGMTASGIAGGLHKMVMRGDLKRTRSDDGSGFQYYTASADYVVMSLEDRVASMQRARAAAVTARTKPAGKAKRVQRQPAQPSAPVSTFDADSILANLNVLQARELMDKLRKLFGV